MFSVSALCLHCVWCYNQAGGTFSYLWILRKCSFLKKKITYLIKTTSFYLTRGKGHSSDAVWFLLHLFPCWLCHLLHHLVFTHKGLLVVWLCWLRTQHCIALLAANLFLEPLRREWMKGNGGYNLSGVLKRLQQSPSQKAIIGTKWSWGER